MIFKSIFERRKYSLDSLKLACTSKEKGFLSLYVADFILGNEHALDLVMERCRRWKQQQKRNVTLGMTNASGLMS